MSLLSFGPSLGPTEWCDLQAINHCTVLHEDQPIGVLFLLQVPEQDIEGLSLPAHRIYRIDLSHPGLPDALVSLHRDQLVQELEVEKRQKSVMQRS